MALNTNIPGTKDPHKSKEKYLSWVNKGKNGLLDDIDADSAKLIKIYLDNMEKGINISPNKKGSRSYARLNAIRSRIPLIANWIKENFDKKLTDVSYDEITGLFNDLRNGKITKANGERYKSPSDYIKDFKAFWNWYIRYARKEFKKDIEDVSIDLDSNEDIEPRFIYFGEDGFKKLMDEAKTDYQDLMAFLYDAGVRFPTELMNIKVSDLSPIENSNKLQLSVRTETSKTFGRKIKLMLCSDRIKGRIKRLDLKGDDFLFDITPVIVNRYLGRLGNKVLGFGDRKKAIESWTDKEGVKRETIVYDVKNGITGYDFRHNSACYWTPRYKKQSALMYRFGWKTFKMVEYYTKFLGMKDTISEDDLLTDITKTDLEKQNQVLENNIELVKEENTQLKDSVDKLTAEMKENKDILDHLEEVMQETLRIAKKTSRVKNEKPRRAD